MPGTPIQIPIVPYRYIGGLEMSNNTTDANNDIDFAVGECASHVLPAAWYDRRMLRQLAATTKRLDAAFDEGSGAGGLDTGSKAADTTYHTYLISKASGAWDRIFSTSVSGPSLPTDYVHYQRTGAVLTDGSGNIRSFIQTDNLFDWNDRIQNLSDTTPETTAALLAVTVPLGVQCIWFGAGFRNNSSGGIQQIVSSSLKTASSPELLYSVAGTNQNHGMWITTNTSSQIYYNSNLASGWTAFILYTRGYLDRRCL